MDTGVPPSPARWSHVREFACVDCGTHTVRSVGEGRPLICTDCSCRRAVEAARSMAEHQGEYYERWKSSRGPAGRPRRRETE